MNKDRREVTNWFDRQIDELKSEFDKLAGGSGRSERQSERQDKTSRGSSPVSAPRSNIVTTTILTGIGPSSFSQYQPSVATLTSSPFRLCWLG